VWVAGSGASARIAARSASGTTGRASVASPHSSTVPEDPPCSALPLSPPPSRSARLRPPLGCEHLHQAARRQGLRTASLWFVGSHSRADGDQADHAAPDVGHDEWPGDRERAAEAIRLLRLPAAERPRLYAWGSGVARGKELGLVRAVDLHPTVARLLGIEPGRPVDGAPIGALLGEQVRA
jgi:hypothetical protein